MKECVEREVEEETGYSVEATGLYGTFIEESDTTEYPVIVFLVDADIVGDGEKNHHFEGEILDYGFFSINKLEEMELRKSNRAQMLDIIEGTEPVSIGRVEDLR